MTPGAKLRPSEMKSSLIRFMHVKLEMTDMMLQWLHTETWGLYAWRKLDSRQYLCQDERMYLKDIHYDAKNTKYLVETITYHAISISYIFFTIN